VFKDIGCAPSALICRPVTEPAAKSRIGVSYDGHAEQEAENISE